MRKGCETSIWRRFRRDLINIYMCLMGESQVDGARLFFSSFSSSSIFPATAQGARGTNWDTKLHMNMRKNVVTLNVTKN